MICDVLAPSNFTYLQNNNNKVDLILKRQHIKLFSINHAVLFWLFVFIGIFFLQFSRNLHLCMLMFNVTMDPPCCPSLNIHAESFWSKLAACIFDTNTLHLLKYCSIYWTSLQSKIYPLCPKDKYTLNKLSLSSQEAFMSFWRESI